VQRKKGRTRQNKRPREGPFRRCLDSSSDHVGGKCPRSDNTTGVRFVYVTFLDLSSSARCKIPQVTGTATEFLTRFFVEDLPFTPTAAQIDLFQSDLALVSPYLMVASLKEVKAGTLGNVLIYRPSEWRVAIFTVYNRKVAEHAQLFPLFHTFETAFRSTVAVTLEEHYRHPRWWRGVYDQLRRGKAASDITHVAGVPLRRDAAHLVAQLIYALDGDSLHKGVVDPMQNGYEFTECCDLVHIRQLITTHWGEFSSRFRRPPTRLTLNDFKAKFDRVRDARNDVYHHKSVARLRDAVATAEELLDYLNCSVRFVCAKITSTSPSPLGFSIPIESRHNTW
jgi:hypothetical protein